MTVIVECVLKGVPYYAPKKDVPDPAAPVKVPAPGECRYCALARKYSVCVVQAGFDSVIAVVQDSVLRPRIIVLVAC